MVAEHDEDAMDEVQDAFQILEDEEGLHAG